VRFEIRAKSERARLWWGLGYGLGVAGLSWSEGERVGFEARAWSCKAHLRRRRRVRFEIRAESERARLWWRLRYGLGVAGLSWSEGGRVGFGGKG